MESFVDQQENCVFFYYIRTLIVWYLHRNSSQADLLRVAIILAQLYVSDKASRVCISIFIFELVQF